MAETTKTQRTPADPRRGDILWHNSLKSHQVWVEDVCADYILYRYRAKGPVHACPRAHWYFANSTFVFKAPDEPAVPLKLTEDFDPMRKEAQRMFRELFPKDICIAEGIKHHSFPKMFPNSLGPWSGKGGLALNAFTQFQIDVYVRPEGEAVVFANGRYWKWVERFSFNFEGV